MTLSYTSSVRLDFLVKCHFCDKYTKPTECVDIIYSTSSGFYSWCPEARVRRTIAFRVQLLPWKQESVGLVLSGYQLGKPSDERWIMSTHEGSFVFIILPP